MTDGDWEKRDYHDASEMERIAGLKEPPKEVVVSLPLPLKVYNRFAERAIERGKDPIQVMVKVVEDWLDAQPYVPVCDIHKHEKRWSVTSISSKWVCDICVQERKEQEEQLRKESESKEEAKTP